MTLSNIPEFNQANFEKRNTPWSMSQHWITETKPHSSIMTLIGHENLNYRVVT